MSLIIVILIAVSLSMDAFSLSLVYGTLNICRKNINELSVTVGIYHFIMPLIGMTVGRKIINYLPVKPPIVIFIVLFIIGIQMIIESFKNQKNIKNLSFFDMFVFGLAVSLDSFSIGFGLKYIYKNYIIAAFIFSLSSFIFTYLGLILGKKINNVIGNVATFIGGFILIIIGTIYLVR